MLKELQAILYYTGYRYYRLYKLDGAIRRFYIEVQLYEVGFIFDIIKALIIKIGVVEMVRF